MADVTDEQQVETAVDAVVAEHGSVDVVVNCAGVAGGGPVHWVQLSEWERVLRVNLTGTFLVRKHALRHMVEQARDPERAAHQVEAGSIVNVASVEGIEGTEGGSAYNASKGAVVILTKNLAIDYGRLGIRVNPDVAAETHPYITTGAGGWETRGWSWRWSKVTSLSCANRKSVSPGTVVPWRRAACS